MNTFKDFIGHLDEGFFGIGRPQDRSQQPVQLPTNLAYHIADAINGAMVQAGKMEMPGRHTPPGASGNYDASLKLKLREIFYGKAKQMLASGDQHALLDYFGFDAARNIPVAPGRFATDIQASIAQAA